jgi:flagellar L-ring protein FlgH
VSHTRRLAALALGALLAGCNTLDRLQHVGREPELTPIGPSPDRPTPQPISLPMPPPEPMPSAGSNSLWRSGAKGFFRDQRARRVGDVLTVQITVTDKAALSNETTRSRNSSDNLGVPNLFGLETKLGAVLPSGSSKPYDTSSLVSASSKTTNQGSGQVQRAESIQTNVAAMITQVLPNGNLVIAGRQEIRVNFEVRDVYVTGIVRRDT